MVRITYKVHDIVIPETNDPTKTISKTVYESETHHAESGMIGFSAPDAVIATGAVVITDSLSVIRGQGAAADTLDFITYGATPEINDKDLVWIVQGAEAITIAHNTSTPPANSGAILLLSQIDKKMIGTRMVLLQRQGNDFQEIAYDGIVGNGGILVTDDDGNAVIVCGSVPSAVNHVKLTNASTGNDVIVEAIGTDPDIGITITPKGTGIITALNTKIAFIREATGAALAIIITGAASIVNHFEFKPSVTLSDLELNALGSDTNIGIKITPKGTGRLTLLEQIVSNIREATGGAIAIAITALASAVNYIEVKANIAANDPEIQAKGSDTDVGIKLIPKGTGEIFGAMETMMIPIGDESTANSATGVKYTFDVPNNISIVSVYQSSTIAPTTAALTLDILDETVTIFSTKPTIAAGANNGEDGVLTTNPHLLTKGDKLEFSIVTLDTGGTSAGTKLFVRFYRTS